MKALISIDELPYRPYRIERIKDDLIKAGYDPHYYMVWTGVEAWDPEDVIGDLFTLEVRTTDSILHRVNRSSWIHTGARANLDRSLTINSSWTKSKDTNWVWFFYKLKSSKKKAPRFL